METKNTNNQISKFHGILEAMVIEFDRSARHRDAIVIEKSADEFDQLLSARDREIAARNLETVSARLREARAALRRIQDGTYGVCLECEEPISPKRLAAMPTAALCIRCQEAQDCDCGALPMAA